jgi:PAS domain S-box-containing protein
MLVNDTHKDPRFAENPLVVSGPKIRFYAGYPLISQEGYRIGALCVLDSKPHSLTKEQQLFLKILGKHAISVMEFKLSINKYKKVVKDLKELRKYKSKSDLKLRAMFESFSDAYFLLGKNGEIIDFNRTAYNFINDIFDVKLSYGRMMTGFLSPSYREDFNRYYSSALNGKKMQVEELTDYGEKGMFWWECDFEPVKDDANEVVGVSYVTRDITERKLNQNKINAQNNVLAQIAVVQSHDYRGPLASILGLMNLIAADDFSASKEYLVMLHSAVNKLDQKIREVVNMVNDSSLE